MTMLQFKFLLVAASSIFALTCGTSTAEPSFTVNEIERTVQGSHAHYRVSYSVNPITTDVFNYWNLRDTTSGFSHLQSTTVNPRNARGNYTSNSVTNITNESSVYFVFGTDSFWYVMVINNTLAQNASLTGISMPEVNTIPREIVYTEGQNATFQIISTGGIDLSFEALTRAGSEEFIELYLGSDVTVTRVSEYVLNITIHTSRKPFSGVLSLKGYLNVSAYPLLEIFEMDKQVAIHPRTQNRPFKDSMFAFYSKFMSRDETGALVSFCTHQQLLPCRVICPTVVGSDRTEMYVTYRGELGPVRVMENPFYIAQYTTDIPRGVDVVHCHAKDIRTGRTISQEVRITGYGRHQLP